MFQSSFLNSLLKKGCFSNYSNTHILNNCIINGNYTITPPAITNYRTAIECKYSIFIEGFQDNIEKTRHLFGDDVSEKLILEYLSCADFNVFLFRYFNLIILNNVNYGLEKKLKIEINADDENLNFISVFTETGKKIYNLIFANVSLDYHIHDIITVNKPFTLNTNISEEYLISIRQKANKLNKTLINIKINDFIQKLNYIPKNIINDTHTQNLIFFNLEANKYENYNVSTIGSIFGNNDTGLLKNFDFLDFFKVKKSIKNLINSIYVVNKTYDFVISGDIRGISENKKCYCRINNESASFKTITDVTPFMNESIFPTLTTYYNEWTTDEIKSVSEIISNDISAYYHKNGIYTNNDIDSLNIYVSSILNTYPMLLNNFNISKEYALSRIIEEYKKLFRYIKLYYPENHILKYASFQDAIYFTIAYCSFIIPEYLGCNNLMDDIITRKLPSSIKKAFNSKLFNENYSEVQVFLYLFFSLFCINDTFSYFYKLDYEPDGSNGKRFEYAFCYKNGYRINIEVKSINCAPENTDNINFIEMYDGQLFYKNYFWKYNKDIEIPKELLELGTELASNFNQVASNINRINEKCENKTKNINIGFLMNNFGTSREEFISYLMHSKYGYFTQNSMKQIDAIVLFSFCTNTDLLMNRICENEHLFVFLNNEKYKNIIRQFLYSRKLKHLLKILRLTNYVENKTDNKYYKFFDEEYGVYIGIKRNKTTTIQRKDNFSQEIFNNAVRELDDTNKNLIKF